MKNRILEQICSVALKRSFKLDAKQKRSLQNMRECKTTRYGGRVVQCTKCGTIATVYNSCNQRGCPICYKANQKRWEDKVLTSVLNVNHFHLVISIPQVFTGVWLRNKKDFMNAFFECVKRAINNISKYYGITPGCIAVFQTHGKGMSYKPHIHCVLSDGGLTGNGDWMPLGTISYTRITDVIKEYLVKELQRKHIQDIPEQKDINDREWNVYATYYQGNVQKIIGYLAHAAKGVVINLNQELVENEEKGTFSYIERHAGKETRIELDKELFVSRYMNHIPVPHTVTVRNYGLYSNQYSDKLEKLQKIFPMEIEMEEAECVDHCPICHAAMEIIMTLEPYEEVPAHEILCKIKLPEK
ncbi:MAG: transposase [Clostridia bacterium]|jgi:hypothetical protein|nr:transposase [Clostridia bacterium]